MNESRRRIQGMRSCYGKALLLRSPKPWGELVRPTAFPFLKEGCSWWRTISLKARFPCPDCVSRNQTTEWQVAVSLTPLLNHLWTIISIFLEQHLHPTNNIHFT